VAFFTFFLFLLYYQFGNFSRNRNTYFNLLVPLSLTEKNHKNRRQEKVFTKFTNSKFTAINHGVLINAKLAHSQPIRSNFHFPLFSFRRRKLFFCLQFSPHFALPYFRFTFFDFLIFFSDTYFVCSMFLSFNIIFTVSLFLFLIFLRAVTTFSSI
jgi:hypothetical protein